jgi:CheY-like chemotaxis protein
MTEKRPTEENALEIARQRFLQAMPKKADELRDILQSLVADPYNHTKMEELRRGLYALFASVQVFGMEDLAESLRGVLSTLDQRLQSGIPMPTWELEELRLLAQRLSPHTNRDTRSAMDAWEEGSQPRMYNPISVMQEPAGRPVGSSGSGGSAPTKVRVERVERLGSEPPAHPMGRAHAAELIAAASRGSEPNIITSPHRGADPFPTFGDATLEEVADRLGQEIRYGLVKTATQGNTLRIPLGDGSEVLSVTWSAIARIRSHLSEQSGGRVRFEDMPRRGGPAVLAPMQADPADSVDREDPHKPTSLQEVSLQGRRMVVVDDDPAVVWFFSGTLRAQGVEVYEASQGQEVIQFVRKQPVDVILSDILMPGMDGFTLCRELKRDPLTAEVPVILLSWKEDYLQRMRELHAGASGYLRKETEEFRILSHLREVLQSKSTLERSIRTQAVVRGRLDSEIGVVTLLRSTAKEKRSAKVSIQDAWNLYEVSLLDGTVLDVTQTATDGTFSRGESVWVPLLGCTSALYEVATAPVSRKATTQTDQAELLETAMIRGTRRLGAMLDVVSGASMLQAYRVIFDESKMQASSSAPAPLRELIQRLRSGEGPRLMLLNSEVSPHTLESVLRDLVRQGAVREVRGPSGEDRVVESMRVWNVDPLQSAATSSGQSSHGSVVRRWSDIPGPASKAPAPKKLVAEKTAGETSAAMGAPVSAAHPTRTETSTLSRPFADVPSSTVQKSSTPTTAATVGGALQAEERTPVLVPPVAGEIKRNESAQGKRVGPPPVPASAVSGASAAPRAASSAALQVAAATASVAKEPRDPHESSERSETSELARSEMTEPMVLVSAADSTGSTGPTGPTGPTGNDQVPPVRRAVERIHVTDHQHEEEQDSEFTPRQFAMWFLLFVILFALGFIGWTIVRGLQYSDFERWNPRSLSARTLKKIGLRALAEKPSRASGTQQQAAPSVTASANGSGQPPAQAEKQDNAFWTNYGVVGSDSSGRAWLTLEWAAGAGAAPESRAVRVWIDDKLVSSIQDPIAIEVGYRRVRVQRGDEVSYRFLTVRPGVRYQLTF